MKFIQLGYFIGLNGCSMKTEANLNVIKQLPIENILVETGRIVLCNFCTNDLNHRPRCSLVWYQTIACLCCTCENSIYIRNGEERKMDIRENGKRS